MKDFVKKQVPFEEWKANFDQREHATRTNALSFNRLLNLRSEQDILKELLRIKRDCGKASELLNKRLSSFSFFFFFF